MVESFTFIDTKIDLLRNELFHLRDMVDELRKDYIGVYYKDDLLSIKSGFDLLLLYCNKLEPVLMFDNSIDLVMDFKDEVFEDRKNIIDSDIYILFDSIEQSPLLFLRKVQSLKEYITRIHNTITYIRNETKGNESYRSFFNPHVMVMVYSVSTFLDYILSKIKNYD